MNNKKRLLTNKQILLLSGLTALIISIVSIRLHNQKKESASQKALAVAASEHDFQEIIFRYPKTKNVPQALFQLAQLQSKQNPMAAQTTYLELLTRFPQHPLAPQAAYQNLEQLFQTRSIHFVEAGQHFLLTYETSHLKPLVMLMLAQAHHRNNDVQSARILLEDILIFHPQGSWAQKANQLLKQLH
jgi:TolA-binding protein